MKEKIFQAIFEAVVEPEFKRPEVWNQYLENRFQNRVFIFMELLKHKNIITVGSEYWNFHVVPDKPFLYSETLSRFCRTYPFTGAKTLRPEIVDTIYELDLLTNTCSTIVHMTGIDVTLNDACLLLYRMSKYGFPESDYVLRAAKTSLLSRGPFTATEILTLTKLYINHQAFGHLKDNFKFFIKWLANEAQIESRYLLQLAKTAEEISR